MKRAFFFVGILALLLILASCSSEPEILIQGIRFTPEQLAEGQRIYLAYCAGCHGANGEGQFPDAPNQPDNTGRYGAPPHNENGHTWHHGDATLIRYVQEGGVSLSATADFYPMPPFGEQVSENEILTVIAYIKTLWTDEQRTRQKQVTEAGG